MRNALIVKLGAIGDVVMAIPGAYQLHTAGYAVDWVVSDAIAPILQLYPWIHVIPADERALLRGNRGTSLRSLFSLWPKLLRRGTYDLCATLYYDTRYRALTLPVRARKRLMLSRTDRAHTLLHGRHHTDEYARVLTGRADGVTPAQLAPVPVPAKVLPSPRLPVTPRQSRVVLVPGGAKNLLRDDGLRRWPLASYVQLARLLLEAGHEVVLLGGRDDQWASSAFSGLPVTSLIGELSLVETLAMLDSAEVTVTHDTGPLHLAGLVATAILALFGPTDPRGRLPQRPGSVALWGGEGFACRPCYDGRDYAPCPRNGCMEQITPTFAMTVVEQLRDERRRGSVQAPRVLTPQHTTLVHASPLTGSDVGRWGVET